MITTLGWIEYALLPSFSTKKIVAKIDTGAKSSALHGTDFTVSDDSLQFKTIIERQTVSLSAKLLRSQTIRDSSGNTSSHPLISTEIAMGGQSWSIELLIRDRSKMNYSLLLGRDAIAGKFLIDPKHKFLLNNCCC